MRSFLGVPIVAPAGVIGAFYLTEKLDGADFTDEDEELIGLLAAHAAIAIANARLYEQTPGALDRRRAKPAGARPPRRRQPEALRARARSRGRGDRCSSATRPRPVNTSPSCRSSRERRSKSSARSSSSCGRPTSRRTASAARCASTSRCCAGWGSDEIELVLAGELPRGRRARPRGPPHRAGGAPERAQARKGAARRRHAAAEEGTLLLEVEDDGIGFDPDAPGTRSRRLGLTSMEERARRLGGTLEISSAPGAGTTVRLRGCRWLSRSACSSSTTTGWSAKGCAGSSSSRTGSRSWARPPTARRRSRRPTGCART